MTEERRRQQATQNWINRCQIIQEHGYNLFPGMFDIRLEKEGEFIGYFDATKEAIRYAERQLGID